MGVYIKSKTVKAAATRLINSRARDGMVHFLLMKRALVRANSTDVAFSSNDPHFTGAMKDLAGTWPEDLEAIRPSFISPFVKVFGTSGSDKYVSGRWVTNGPADALSGPRWNEVISITGSRPRRGSFRSGYQFKLANLLLKSGSQLPSLVDTAIWYFRGTNLEDKIDKNLEIEKVIERLEQLFINELGISGKEELSLFNSESEVLSGENLEHLFQDEIANPLSYLPDLKNQSSSNELNRMAFEFESRIDDSECGLRLQTNLFLTFTSAQCAKRFLILTGLAGSGKTKLAQAFSRWITESEDCYKVIPVGADWTGNENVLGYPNGLDPEGYLSKPALDLILHARDNKDIPHFLILDEMNLSHVERYFADILSAIESEEMIHLHQDAKRSCNGTEIPAEIELPKNLFIVGTVNVDETTYMFSPKVLDRANVIEFRMNEKELATFLENPAKPDLKQLDGKGVEFAKAFVDAASSPVEVPAEVKEIYDAEMLLLFKTLQSHGAEFGYRTAYEASRFIYFYKLLGDHSDEDTTWFPLAFDCVIFQKLLPKLHGSRVKLGPLLKKLWFLCTTEADARGGDVLKVAEESTAEPIKEIPTGAPYPLSAEKIYRMWRLMMDNGFTSFAEA